MSKIKKYEGRFPDGFPEDIKASLIREAMTIAIKEQQKRILRNEDELHHRFDRTTDFGAVLPFDEKKCKESTSEDPLLLFLNCDGHCFPN